MFTSLMKNGALTERNDWLVALTSVVITGLLTGFYLLIGIPTLPSRWWLVGILLPLMLAGFLYRTRIAPVIHTWWRVLLVVSVVMYGGNILYRTYIVNSQSPPVWDFHVFWLNGKVAAEGLAFYEAESYRQIAEQHLATDLDAGFVAEVIDPAFLYPPPSMFLFAPLGWFEIQTSFVIWVTFQLVFVMLSVYLLWEIFLKRHGLDGLLLTMSLVVICHATYSTVEFAQLNFMMLAGLLLIFRDRNRMRAGVWLALGVLVKPLIAAFLLYFLIKRHWKAIGVMVATLSILSGLTIVVYGAENFLPYFFDNSTSRLPQELFYEAFYQSLMATVIRLTNYDFSSGTPLFQPLILIPMAVVLALTTIIIFRTQDSHQQMLAFALITALILMLYPYSQIYYGILLFLPIFMFVADRDLLGRWPTIGLVTAIYTLSYVGQGQYAFYVFLLVWLVVAFILSRQILRQKRLDSTNRAMTSGG